MAQRCHEWLVALNGRRHKQALIVYGLIVLAHWAEHLAQAVQIYALAWPTSESRGVLGLWFPWVVTSEVLHYSYALVMLVGLWLLRDGFTGRSRRWWMIAFGVQFWHHIEHALLQGQAILGANLLGRPVPTSVVQLWIPRVELHLFYNAVVFIPMAIAVLVHMYPTRAERASAGCRCATGSPAGPTGRAPAVTLAP